MRIVAILPKRSCQNCKKEFVPARRWQKFCTRVCQYENENKKSLLRSPYPGIKVGTVGAIQELKVAVGALYHHVPSQAAMQSAVIQQVLEGVPTPNEIGGTPRQRIVAKSTPTSA